jgi:hypothetical protein
MSDISLLPDDQSAFAPEETHAMSVAFDEVCRALNVAPTAARERQIIATRILDLARSGHADAAAISRRVLSEARISETGLPT